MRTSTAADGAGTAGETRPRPRAGLPLTAAGGALAALAAFRNRPELARELATMAALWLPFGVAGPAGRRLVRPGGRAARLLARMPALGLPLAAGLRLAFVPDPRAALRTLLQLGLLGAPLLLAARLPEIRRLWKQLLAALASTAACLIALHLLAPALLEHFVLRHYEVSLDHRLKPDPGFINRDGVAPDIPPEDYRPEDTNLVFLGDSFTYGWKTPAGTAFPFLVEIILQGELPERSLRVANFGWISSSPVLQYRQLRQLGAAYKPDLVVQCFDMTDFYDDIVYLGRLRQQGWGEPLRIGLGRALEARLDGLFGVPLRRWLRAQLPGPAAAVPAGEGFERPERKFFALWQPLSDSEPLLAPSWQTILKIRSLAGRLGARYALVILPRYQQYDRRQSPEDWEKELFPESDEFILEPFRFFAARAAEVDFPIYSLLEDFRDSGVRPTVLHDDPHFNDAGHWIAARAIAAGILRDRLLEAPAGDPKPAP